MAFAKKQIKLLKEHNIYLPLIEFLDDNLQTQWLKTPAMATSH